MWLYKKLRGKANFSLFEMVPDLFFIEPNLQGIDK